MSTARRIDLLRLLRTPLLALLVLAWPAVAAGPVHSGEPGRDAITATDDLKLERLDQTGGTALAIAVRGDTVYVGQGSRLLVVDVSDPAAPTLVGVTSPLPEIVQAIALRGHYAFLAVGNAGLRVIDVSDPAGPVEVGHWQEAEGAKQLAIAGGIAYLIVDGGLVVLDISDPTAPQEVGFYEVAANDVAVDSGYVYLAAALGLQILSVADPSAPQLVGRVTEYDSGHRVVVDGDHVYMTAREEHWTPTGSYEAYMLLVVDVSDKSDPIRLARLPLTDLPLDVVVEGHRLYTTYDDVTIFDVTVPREPVGLGQAVTPGYAVQMAISGDQLYVADYYGGLRVISQATPAAPVEVGYLDTAWSPTAVALSGNHVYVTAGSEGLVIIERRAPADNRVVGVLDTPGEFVNLAVTREFAFVADTRYGLRVINIANPAAPALAGSLATPYGAVDVVVQGRLAYVKSRNGSLRVIDVRDPTHPVEVGYLDLVDNPWGSLFVAGRYVYWTYTVTNPVGLLVIDVGNPASPVVVGRLDSPGVTEGVVVAGGYAYLADGEGGLRVADVSDPRRPREVGYHTTFGLLVAVAVNEEFVYAADVIGVVRVFDVSDPGLPVEITWDYSGVTRTNDVAVRADVVYATHSDLGLLVLGHFGPQTIAGRVVDDNGAPLAGVRVSAGPRQAVSDVNGAYRLTRLQPGAYRVAARLPGYWFAPPARPVTVPPDPTQVNFTAEAWDEVWSVRLPIISIPD